VSVEIRGVEQLAALSKALKAAGDKELQSELSKGISAATRPMINSVKQSARAQLPQRGGLAKRVAATSIRTSRTRQGVRLRARNANLKGLAAIDRGIVRHPVFGNRNEWVTQRVNPGFWTEPLEASAPEARREIEAAMRTVIQKIDRAV
jgi:hypothetical protein